MKPSRKKKDRPFSRASAPKLRARRRDKSDGVPVRVEFGSDSSTSVTSLRTPEPLPPSPAAQDAEGWFEQVPTNPAEIPDLGALAGGTDPDSVPAWALPASAGPPSAEHDAVLHQPAPSQHARTLWLLLAATCLAVGMVLGALLYSQLATHTECPDPAAHRQTEPG